MKIKHQLLLFTICTLMFFALVNYNNNSATSVGQGASAKGMQTVASVMADNSPFFKKINTVKLVDTIGLNYNRLLDYNTDSIKPIPDSVIVKYFRLPKYTSDPAHDPIKYQIYRRLNLSSQFYSLVFFKDINDTSLFFLSNYTKTGKFMGKVELCANWGDYGRLGGQVSKDGKIYTKKYIMGKDLPTDQTRLYGKYIYGSYHVNLSTGDIITDKVDSGKLILKITETGDVIEDHKEMQ